MVKETEVKKVLSENNIFIILKTQKSSITFFKVIVSI